MPAAAPATPEPPLAQPEPVAPPTPIALLPETTPAPQPLTPDLSQLSGSREVSPAVCAPDVAPKQGSSTLKWIIIIAVVVVVLCCGCMLLGAILFFSTADSSNNISPLNDMLRSLLGNLVMFN
jgi:hypothetical protein